MAEVLGIVGSAVGVVSTALELAHSIKKLKDFRARVADAPKNLQRTVQDIEAMSSLLTQLNDKLESTTDSPGSQSLQACTEHCRVGVDRIFAVTEELDRRMSEKRLHTSLRFAFNRDHMLSMMQGLEQAKSSLVLAHLIYTQAQAEDAARTQDQQIKTLLAGQVVITRFVRNLHAAASLDQEQDGAKSVGLERDHPADRLDHSKSVGPCDENAIYLQARNKGVSPLLDNATNNVLTIRTPAWLRWKVWELSVARAVNLWACSLKVSLSTYRIVNRSSPVAVMCETGDLLGLQRLFSAGEASPLDRVEMQTGPHRRGEWSLFRVS